MAPIVAGLLVSLAILYSLAIFPGEPWVRSTWLDTYYMAHLEGLLSGRFMVPCSAVAGEQFMRNGECFGYWGPTPSLLRLFTVPFFGFSPHVAPLLQFAACVLTQFFLAGILVELAKKHPFKLSLSAWPIFFFFSVSTSTIFMVAPVNLFRESICWAVAWNFGAIFFWLRWISSKGTAIDGSAGVIAACLALGARFHIGLPMIITFLLADIWRNFNLPRWGPISSGHKKSWWVTLLASSMILAYGGYNYQKTGGLNPYPMTRYKNWEPLVDYKVSNDLSPENSPEPKPTFPRLFGIERVVDNAWAYTFSASKSIKKEYPFLNLAYPRSLSGKIIYGEPIIPLVLLSPLLLICAFGGLLITARNALFRETNMNLLILIIANGATALVTLSFHIVTMRYAHDLLPFLLSASLPMLIELNSTAHSKRWIPFLFSVYGVISLGLLTLGTLAMDR